MSVDFPNNPVDGQIHQQEGTTWVYKSPPDVWAVGYNTSEGGSCPFPVDGIYMSVSPADPSTIWASTTWEAFAEGRTTVGVGNNGESDWTGGETRGSETHTLSESQMPSHNHSVDPPSQTFTSNTTGSHSHSYDDGGAIIASGGYFSQSSGSLQYSSLSRTTGGNGSHSHTTTVNLSAFNSASKGGGSAHNNVQPSIATYMWRRLT